MEGTVDAYVAVGRYFIRFSVFGIEAHSADGGLDVVLVGQTEVQWIVYSGVGVQVGRAAAPYLEVEVRATAATGIAAVGHQLPLFYRQFAWSEEFADAVTPLGILLLKDSLSDGAGIVVEVHIDGGVSVGVLDIKYLSAAPGRDAHLGHIAVGRRVDRLSDGAAGAHVEARVEVART